MPYENSFHSLYWRHVDGDGVHTQYSKQYVDLLIIFMRI